MDLILCRHLPPVGACTGIDWNEFNSLSELERSLNLEHEEEEICPVPQRKRDIFFVVFME